MNPFPAECSVLVLNNCRIHHNDVIAELVQAAGMSSISSSLSIANGSLGCLILYLPTYSPDLNPIEESFSTHESHITSSQIGDGDDSI